MGHTVNPRALRLKGSQEFLNNWFSLEKYSDFLLEDYEIRRFIKNQLKRSFISKTLIKRKGNEQIVVDIHSSKPGIILGKAGESINRFREALANDLVKSLC